jgi:hypothetical protein
MSRFKGWYGEKKTAFNLWASLDSDLYHRYHNLIVPSKNGTTQIDHLIVSLFGLFIIETKNKDGWIFGSLDQPKWTQSIFGKNYSFQNPLRQTFRQKKVLSSFLNIQDSKIHPIICFVGNCEFKTQLPQNVIKRNLGLYIKQFNEQTLPLEAVIEINRRLEILQSKFNLSKSDHLHSLNTRHNSNTNCPKCGSRLVIRLARNGPNEGTQFLGCENYPNCKFTKSL